MIIYKFRPDMVYDCEVEVPDGTTIIPKFHTFQAPPEQEGYYAVMQGGWILVEGEKPVYPPVPVPPPPPTPEQIIGEYTKEIQNRLDEFAQTRGYDGILSACTYANSPTSKFATEGQYCVVQRDATWAAAYNILDLVLSGSRPMPTLDELFTELPQLEWPN
jgi:hypothetical protein